MAPTDTARKGPMYLRALANIARIMRTLMASEEHGGRGLLQKEIALGAGFTETTFSQKLKSIRTHFYEDDMEQLAVYFREQTGRPLIGFPHLEWNFMETVDRKVAGWKPTRET